LNDDALYQRTEKEADEWYNKKGYPKIAGQFQREPCQHGANHKKIAVRDVYDVEQTENDRKAEGDEGNDQAPNEPVQRKQQQRVQHDDVWSLMGRA